MVVPDPLWQIYGNGANSYQLWLGGSPVLAERTASPHMSKMDTNALETTLEPILAFFIEKRDKFESFGDWLSSRLGGY